MVKDMEMGLSIEDLTGLIGHKIATSQNSAYGSRVVLALLNYYNIIITSTLLSRLEIWLKYQN